MAKLGTEVLITSISGSDKNWSLWKKKSGANSQFLKLNITSHVNWAPAYGISKVHLSEYKYNSSSTFLHDLDPAMKRIDFQDSPRKRLRNANFQSYNYMWDNRLRSIYVKYIFFNHSKKLPKLLSDVTSFKQQRNSSGNCRSVSSNFDFSMIYYFYVRRNI